MQPLICTALFAKGLVLWTNSHLSCIALISLLYIAYIDAVHCLFGATLIGASVVMICMKFDRLGTIFVLSLFVALASDIENGKKRKGRLPHCFILRDSSKSRLKRPTRVTSLVWLASTMC